MALGQGGPRSKEQKHNEPGPSQKAGPNHFPINMEKARPWVLGWNVNPSVPGPQQAAAEWAALGLQVPRSAFDRLQEVPSTGSHRDRAALKPERHWDLCHMSCLGAHSLSTEAVVLYLIYKRDPKIIIINYPRAGE